VSLSNQEINSSKEYWQETAKNKEALASALANLRPKDIKRLKKYTDLAQLIGGLAISAGLKDPFHTH
jgi:hypothetical protein